MSDSVITTLDKIHVGRDCNIVSVTMSSDFKQRFSEIGILFGATLRITRTAPLGDPIQLKIDTMTVCIRLCDAKHIHVKPLI